MAGLDADAGADFDGCVRGEPGGFECEKVIAEVLAGMGDTLKERLLGMSGDFRTEEDEDSPKYKK